VDTSKIDTELNGGNFNWFISWYSLEEILHDECLSFNSQLGTREKDSRKLPVFRLCLNAPWRISSIGGRILKSRKWRIGGNIQVFGEVECGKKDKKHGQRMAGLHWIKDATTNTVSAKVTTA